MAASTATEPSTPAPPLGWVDRQLARVLLDERDLLMVRVLAALTLVLPPWVAVLFVAPTWLTLVLALPYWATVYLGFGGRYMLMLHALCHRRAFKPRFQWLETWAMWGIAPLFGNTPNSFYVHHLGMHHAEENGPHDLSSTLPYQRDRLAHFLHYYLRFFLFGYLHFPRYFLLRRRMKLLRKWLVGEASWLGVTLALASVDWAFAVVVLVVPMCLIRWFAMCGNFAQHAFVDVTQPENPWRVSNCLTDTPYNQKCYNDGYHIVHHLFPGMHWTEMPGWYEQHRDEFARHDAVVFSGIRNNQQMWFLLMTQQYDVLARHLVDFRGRTHDERVSFLKSRVRGQSGPIRGWLEWEAGAGVPRA